MIAIKLVIIAVISYLLGSLNFGVILSKRVVKDDVREHGSGNAGTTNMMRSYGKVLGALTIIGDMAKVAVAIVIAKLILSVDALSAVSILSNNTDVILKSFAGLFCVLGHIFPCFFGFKGGKGVATSGGMVFMIDPYIALILLMMFIIVVFFSRYVSLGSLVMAFFYPILILIFYKSVTLFLIALVFAIIVFVAHRNNIKAIINHTENKVQFKSDNEDDEEIDE